MISANPVSARHGLEWLLTGWKLFVKQPYLWLRLASIYLAIAMLLEQIPFIGWLILVLLSPTLLFGALPIAKALFEDNLPPDLVPAPADESGAVTARTRILQVVALYRAGANRLFSGFRDQESFMSVMIISTLLLGGVIGIRLLASLLKVGSSLHALLAGSIGPAVWGSDLVAAMVVLVLLILLAMSVVQTVPLMLWRRDYPLSAIESSFNSARSNFGAFSIFFGVFLILAFAARVLFFILDFPFDYLAFLIMGLVALPVLTGGLYAGYVAQFVPRASN